MKVRVLIPFRDKVANKVRKEGTVFEVSENRFNEIIKVGNLIEIIKDEPKTKA